MAQSTQIRVLALTQGLNVPSSRFRIRQYISKLEVHGIEVVEMYPLCGAYPPRNKFARPFWLLRALYSRLLHARLSWQYDLVIFQRSLISTIFTVEALCKRPCILDVDDAVWLTDRLGATDRIAKRSRCVFGGSKDIVTHYQSINDNVIYLPTTVDTARYKYKETRNQHTIGWSGSSSGFPYLYAIEASLVDLLNADPVRKLLIVADEPPKFRRIPSNRIEYRKWSPEIEVGAINDMSVGLMPLHDTEWARSKCAFKLLTYLSCRVPVVASAVGMNVDVIEGNEVGMLARTDSDWRNAVNALMSSSETRETFGKNGRMLVERKYSVDSCLNDLVSAIRSAVKVS